MKKKPFWKTTNPKKTSTPLTPEQKAEARARAKAAGRPYPNLIDNAAVARKKKKQCRPLILNATTVIQLLS